MNIGERLRQLREKTGYTQNALAERAGVAQTHLRKVELGESGISVEHLGMICDALEITLKDFFDYGNEQDELSLALSGLTPKQKGLLVEFLKSL